MNEEQELGNQSAIVGAIALCLVSAATFTTIRGWWLVPLGLGVVVLGLLLYRGGSAAGRRPTVLILGLGVLAGPALYGLAALAMGFISAVV